MPWVNYKAEALSVRNKFSLIIPEKSIPEKRVLLEAYIEAVSFRFIATVEQLQLEQTHRHTA